VIPSTPDDAREFRAPASITPRDLGDQLAQLVWESFTDFVTDGDAEQILGHLGLVGDDGVPVQRASEEILIFLMWAHTRGIQMAFVGRGGSRRLAPMALDQLHKAVFDDMVDQGIPRSQLPIFEQRVSARYSEYYQASERSDHAVGAALVRHLTGSRGEEDALAWALAERAIAVIHPIRDFFGEVELVQ
jgi:hypothetical protein